MKQAQSYRSEAEQIFRVWFARTIAILEAERKKLKVEDSKELKQSLRGKIMQVASDKLGGQIYFLTRGRFVDMGAGRPRSVADLGTPRKRLKRRRPKKWYSPAFYGRLNDLQGALGIELMEQCLETFRNEIG